MNVKWQCVCCGACGECGWFSWSFFLRICSSQALLCDGRVTAIHNMPDAFRVPHLVSCMTCRYVAVCVQKAAQSRRGEGLPHTLHMHGDSLLLGYFCTGQRPTWHISCLFSMCCSVLLVFYMILMRAAWHKLFPSSSAVQEMHLSVSQAVSVISAAHVDVI